MFPFAGFVILVIGILNIIFPQAGWYMRYGWQFKDAEPSDAALVMSRVGGGFAAIMGLVILFGGFGSQ